MGKEYAVELQDVIKRFGAVTAVNHVSLKIHDGEFFSLLGPSGCGKTTTLRLIAGFEMPTNGQIYIGGETQGYLPAYKRPVNTVFQHYALFPHWYASPNAAAEELFDDEFLSDPTVYPPQEVLDRLQFIRPVGEAESIYQRLWDEIKSAQ